MSETFFSVRGDSPPTETFLPFYEVMLSMHWEMSKSIGGMFPAALVRHNRANLIKRRLFRRAAAKFELNIYRGTSCGIAEMRTGGGKRCEGSRTHATDFAVVFSSCDIGRDPK